jgi:DNA repair protein RadD
MYLQQVGRGLRIAEGKNDCLVLDFAGNIATHGPITDVRPPAKKGEKQGEAPVKVCENCQEIVHLSVRVCPACGKAFPPPVKEKTRLYQDDIMGEDNKHVLKVKEWSWRKQTSSRGNLMLVVTYYGFKLSDPPVKQYFTIYNDGYAGDKARKSLFEILIKAGVSGAVMAENPTDISKAANKGTPPKSVQYSKNGKFFNVTGVKWTSE